MPTTKTSSLKIKARYYINDALNINQELQLNEMAAYHFTKVLRGKSQDYIRVFNEKYGEFTAKIVSITKQQVTIQILEQYKEYILPKQHIHLAFAPLKKDATDIVLEKATELGVQEISFVITERTTNKPINPTKGVLKVINATQQCERLDIPKINPSITLTKFIANYNTPIFWLNEKRISQTFNQHLQATWVDNPIFLIGPEGGFTDAEYTLLSHTKNIYPVHFKGNILRAETACLASLILYQSMASNL